MICRRYGLPFYRGIALCLAFAHFAAADVGNTDKDLLSEFDTARSEISLKEKSQREVMGALFAINQRIHATAKKRAQLNTQLLESDSQVRTAAQEVTRMEELVLNQRDQLNNHLRQLYQSRRINPMQWLFSAKSPNELERHYRFLRKFLNMDHDLLTHYAASLDSLTDRRNRLLARVTELSKLQKSIASQEVELNREQVIKAKFLRSIRSDKNQKLAVLKELRKQHSDLNDIIEYAFFEKRGTLAQPVDGMASRGFGTYVDSDFHFSLAHKGLFFPLKAESPVRTIADGVVTFADKLRGYEKLVIIDHGDNYYSIYAHNSAIKVKKGQRVEANSVIATSGGASPLFGQGLYFEIRHFSDAIDPRPWFKDSIIKTAAFDGKIEHEESPQ
jgi:septal ring factor EnvC (AmiA/AmiB activator)